MPSIHRGSVVINHFAIYVGDWKSRRNGNQDAIAAEHLSNRVDPRFQRSRFDAHARNPPLKSLEEITKHGGWFCTTRRSWSDY